MFFAYHFHTLDIAELAKQRFQRFNRIGADVAWLGDWSHAIIGYVNKCFAAGPEDPNDFTQETFLE